MDRELPRGTRAHTPDLDWSQVRETVLMLEVAAGQVEAAMRDSNSSVEVLTDTFTTMAGLLDAADAAIASLPDEGEQGETKAKLRWDVSQVGEKVQAAIVAFQFYDKLAQRLAHVCHSLGDLSSLVGDKGRLYNPMEWVALQGRIREKFTMPDEIELFDAVLAGAPVNEALERYMAARMKVVEVSGGEIELF